MTWGESNSINFLNWADFCQDAAQRQRGIKGNSGPNFSNDRSSNQYNLAKAELLNLIHRNRTITVQQLYNQMPANLLTNPTTKNVLLQLFFEDNIKIQGEGSTVSERERNYTLVFSKGIQKSESRPTSNVQRKQSNIEDLLDSNWTTTGRKLQFEKQEKPNRENLNISLRRTPRPVVSAPAVKPIVDIKKPVEPPKKVDAPPVIKDPIIQKPVENKNMTYIQIPKPSPVKEEIIPSFTSDFKPKPTKNIEPNFDQTIFYGLSAYQLYFMEAFLSDAVGQESNKSFIKSLKESIRTKADVIYLKANNGMNIGLKIFVGFLCLILVGIIIFVVVGKNKVRAKAIKDYNSRLKKIGYTNLKEKLKNKYPKIINF